MVFVTVGVPATAGADVTAVAVAPTTRWMVAFLWGSLTTVMDRLFLPGNIYVSLTHTIPSRRLALTLDEVTDEEDDMDARIKINFLFFFCLCFILKYQISAIPNVQQPCPHIMYTIYEGLTVFVLVERVCVCGWRVRLCDVQ